MPIACDPGESFGLSLARDEGKPEDRRPVFRFHYLSSREWRMRLRLLREWEAYCRRPAAERSMEQAEAFTDRFFAALRGQFAGAEHVALREGGPADLPADLDAVLTDPEARELFTDACRMSELSVPEKNASASPPLSGTAVPAAATVPTAPTPQPPQSRSGLSAPDAAAPAATTAATEKS